MSDNYHQAMMGGTGANHVMLGTGDAIFWSDGNGNPTTPPSHIANRIHCPARTMSTQ
jgi:phospholipase C